MHTQVRVRVNGTDRSLEKGTTVSALIRILALTERKIAVEINQEIVPQSKHEQTQLCDGDRVEIIEAIGGG